jgi:hypothetical protein
MQAVALDKLNSKAEKLREQWKNVGTDDGPKTFFELVESIDVTGSEKTESDAEFESMNKTQEGTQEGSNKPLWDYNKCMKIDC